MEISGKIIYVAPLEQGTSQKGTQWQIQRYVLETQEQYPRKVAFEVFGEQRIIDNPCTIDDVVTIHFDLESREYNGKWYTNVRAWKVTRQNGQNEAQTQSSAPSVQEAAPVQSAPAQAPVPAPFDPQPQEEGDDLPF